MLEHVNELLHSSGEVPELASPGQNQQADCIQDQLPVCHGKAANCVSQYLQHLDRHTGPVAHDSNVGLPFEPLIYEEPKVLDVLQWLDHVVGGVCRIREDQLLGSWKQVMLIQLLEE